MKIERATFAILHKKINLTLVWLPSHEPCLDKHIASDFWKWEVRGSDGTISRRWYTNRPPQAIAAKYFAVKLYQNVD